MSFRSWFFDKNQKIKGKPLMQMNTPAIWRVQCVLCKKIADPSQ
jgi:hypothetical protein